MTKRRSYRRGFAVTTLIGLEERRATVWQVFSRTVKRNTIVELCGKRQTERSLYNFHESIVDALRPMLKEGVRSIVAVAPMKTDYAAQFLDHVRKHHAWLTQGKGAGVAAFGELVGSAGQFDEVSDLVKTKEFQKLTGKTASEEASRMVDTLEKSLNSADDSTVILYSLSEIEELVFGEWIHGSLKPEHLMITDKYLEGYRDKNRINRLLQISKNKSVKTRVVSFETPAGKRLGQMGGLVCVAKSS